MTSMKTFSQCYSRETLTLIENYMNKAKLSILQKQTILDDLRKGKPIPISLVSSKMLSRKEIHHHQFSPRKPKRRRKETIVQSGAYDMSHFTSDNSRPTVDREVEKQRLRDIFYGLDQIPEESNIAEEEICCRPSNSLQDINEYDRMNELINEIQDRIQFLEDMEKVGLKRKYEFDITNEISRKLRELEDLWKKCKT